MAATTAGRRAGSRAAALALLLLAAVPATATELNRGPASDDPIWTDRPVRIDRRKQRYERLAVPLLPTLLRIRVSSRVNVLDSASFEDGGRLYVLTDIVPVDPSRFCRGAAGAIAVCGQQARIALRWRIANRTLSCKEDFRGGLVSFLTCRSEGKDVAEALVASGAGWAATPRLYAAQEKAMRQGTGIWMDQECLRLRRCPPGSGR
ncbi:thermonuclease family protein [Shinella sp. BYT-45]|uniref:thermonuclease family protein n=1 Tax=Shinella sp. BYT-45 TaxID=3377377 RepID=UPI003981754F